jgi:roadblock/LC7 domain-containing protein
MVQKIIAAGLHSADQECNAYTADLMEKLEQAKAQNPNEDAILDDVAASAYCEQFALQTLAKGDKEMAEDKATKCVVPEQGACCHTDCAPATPSTRSSQPPRSSTSSPYGRKMTPRLLLGPSTQSTTPCAY